MKRPGGDSAEVLVVADIMGGNSTDGATPTARPEIVAMRAAMAKLRRRVADLEAFDPNRIENRKDPAIESLSKAIDDTLVEVFGGDTPEYQRYIGAKHIDTAPFLLNGTPMALVRSGLEQGKTTAIALLDQAIASFEEAIAEGKALSPPRAAAVAPPAAAAKPAVAAAPEPSPSIVRKGPSPAEAAAAQPMSAAPPPVAAAATGGRDVLVVCGHDTVVSGEIARFLRKAELDAILMHEQGPEALTDVERLERHSGVGFAVVLLPPEEEKAAPPNGAHRPRGRAALVAELYYFAGKLGRGRVCALTTSETAAPPVTGVSYAVYDPYEGWQKWLLKALEEAGYQIDWGKALR
ncbi:MAG TPA: TIR domain-containing protein [Stellaceae bacterium]|nr:TIR domain-containing protein [Stellaceae bacterium]